MYDKSTKKRKPQCKVLPSRESGRPPMNSSGNLTANIISPLMLVPALKMPNARSSLLHRMMVLYRTGKAYGVLLPAERCCKSSPLGKEGELRGKEEGDYGSHAAACFYGFSVVSGAHLPETRCPCKVFCRSALSS